jgi:hypothetical protein
MYAEQQNKVCIRCKQNKSINEFHYRCKKQGTKMPYCKECRASHAKVFYQENKSRINPTRYKYNKNYRLSNPEKTKAWQRNWRKINYELSKELHRRYYVKNKKKRHANSRKYELAKINATPKWRTRAQINDISQIYETCPEGYHVDHIVPLRGKEVCGLHVSWNLRHLPANENLTKSNKLNLEAAEIEDKKPLY